MFNEEALLQRRQQEWARLEALSQKAAVGFDTMSPDEVVEFVRLYRRASGDLALFMTQSGNESVVSHLNGLVANSYGLLYRRPTLPLRGLVLSVLDRTLLAVRRNAAFTWVSALIFFAGAFFAPMVLGTMPHLRELVVPSHMESMFQSWQEGELPARGADDSVAAWAMYVTNNPRVALLTCAGAASTFGVLTVFILWTNGAMLGALSYDMVQVGKLDFLLISVSPHGITEIGGIFLAGAGGLILGRALIAPGRRTRGDSLRKAIPDALLMGLMGIAMTVLAAPVEGFLSFNPAVPDWAKISLATATLMGWWLFFSGFRKREVAELAHKLREPRV